MPHRIRAGLVILWPLLLASCAATDPFGRPGMWNFTGANAANLAVMVADPLDLARGRDHAIADGRLAAAAVSRLRNDRAKPLPNSDTTSVMSSGGGSGGGATAAAPAGATE